LNIKCLYQRTLTFISLSVVSLFAHCQPHNVPTWYDVPALSTTQFVFYGEGSTLAAAKVSAVVDLSRQLMTLVSPHLLSQAPFSKHVFYEQSELSVKAALKTAGITDIKWGRNVEEQGNHYIVGTIERVSLIQFLINELEKGSKLLSFIDVNENSFYPFLKYKRHQVAMDTMYVKALLLNQLCKQNCVNKNIIDWEQTYSRIVEFPKTRCLKLAPDMDAILRNTLSQWFHKMGFMAGQYNCFLVDAQMSPKYFKKDNLKWAKGWLVIQLNPHSSDEPSYVGKVYLNGNSPRSYQSAFHNALSSFLESPSHKNNLFSSMMKL